VTRYLDLAEYRWLAEQVTGVDAATLAKASRIDLPTARCTLRRRVR
jgi:death-on-curing protein